MGVRHAVCIMRSLGPIVVIQVATQVSFLFRFSFPLSASVTDNLLADGPLYNLGAMDIIYGGQNA